MYLQLVFYMVYLLPDGTEAVAQRYGHIQEGSVSPLASISALEN